MLIKGHTEMPGDDAAYRRHGIRYGHRAFTYSFPTANITLNMKRTFFILTAFFALLSSSIPSLAFDCKVGGIYYDLNNDDKTASVTYMGLYSSGNKDAYVGNIIIPESTTYNGTTYSVTSIGKYAFRYCSGLTSVTIPNPVTSIGDYAFDFCPRLTSVTIPNSVTSIGKSAFSYCSRLTSVVVDKNNGTYDSRDNCNAIIHTFTNNLIVGCNNTIIPNSVTAIGDGAFYGCEGLTSVTIPNSVTSIGDGAFEVCSGLTSVTIPNAVTSIGKYAFRCCFGLTSVTVDKNNGTYDSRDNCNAIIETSTNKLIVGCNNTIIPNSVTSIGEYAFYFCFGLTTVTIPNSVTSIGESAFSYCSGLTTVTIPNSVTSIGDWAFRGCSGLTKLVSLAVEPPTCGEGVFEKVDKTACQLIVPEESVNKYKAADQWEEFVYISGYSGVDDVSVDTQDAVYEVYNLQGVRVGSGMREAEVTADVLPHGVYILVSPQGRKKLKI